MIRKALVLGIISLAISLGALWLAAKITVEATQKSRIGSIPSGDIIIEPDTYRPLAIASTGELATLGDIKAVIGFSYCGNPIAVELIGDKGFFVQVIMPGIDETAVAAYEALQYGKLTNAPFRKIELKTGCKST